MTRYWNCVLAAVVAVFSLTFQEAAAQTSRTGGTSGTSGTGQSSQTGQAAQMDVAGQISGSERFLRENRDPGQLVGGSVEGVGNLRGQTDSAGQATNGMLGGQTGRFNTTSQFGNMFNSGSMFNSMSRQRQQLRVPLRLGPNGVSFAQATPAVATGPNVRVQKYLARIPQLKNSDSLSVEMEGQVAVLRGEVSSQHERDLVARLVLLEPGIADVRNELQVAPQPSPTP